jgi:adenylate cyclase
MGRFTEAKIEAEKAQELEPLSIIINAVNGYTFILSRQYNKAIVEIKKALDIDPNSIIALFFIAYAYILKSKYADAIKFSQKAVSLVEGSTFWLAGLGMVYGMSGKKDKARKVIEELNQKSKTQYVAAIQSAWIYSSLDEKNKAFEWLNKAFDEHDISLYDLKSNPIYDTLRGDPRFDELLKKIGFEP